MLDPMALAKTAIYWPELLWDNTVQNLSPGGLKLGTNLFGNNWQGFEQANIFVQVPYVTTIQQAGVTLNVQTEAAISPTIPTSLRPNGLPGPGSWVAHKQLAITLQNGNPQGSAALLTQLDGGLWVWPLNDGLRYAFNILGPNDTTPADVRARLPGNLGDLIDDGLRPLTGPQMLAREDMVWVQQEIDTLTNVTTVGSGPGNTQYSGQVYSMAVPPGRCYVLNSFTCDPSLGGTQTLAQQQVMNPLLAITRDQQSTAGSYITPSLAGLLPTRTVSLWSPALTRLTVTLWTTTQTSNFPINLTVADLPLSFINKIRWSAYTGLAEDSTNARLWAMVKDSGW